MALFALLHMPYACMLQTALFSRVGFIYTYIIDKNTFLCFHKGKGFQFVREERICLTWLDRKWNPLVCLSNFFKDFKYKKHPVLESYGVSSSSKVAKGGKDPKVNQYNCPKKVFFRSLHNHKMFMCMVCI